MDTMPPIVFQANAPTCPDAIANWLAAGGVASERVGMEIGDVALTCASSDVLTGQVSSIPFVRWSHRVGAWRLFR